MEDAVRWLVTALAGAATEAQVADRLAPRLTGRGDVAAFFTSSRRFAAFREHPPRIERLERRGDWSAYAIVRTGPTLWELDVAVEPEPPHRIRSFQPREAAADGIELAEVSERLRGGDRDEPDAAPGGRRLDTAATSVVGLAAGLLIDGEVVYRGFRGLADLSSGTAIDEHSVFRVGSVTKVVTALTVLHLVATGVVELGAPVDRYLPAVGLPTPPTVEQLLLHRGGLPKDALSRDGIRQPWPPGDRAEYSNLGYRLLAAVVEKVSAEPYPVVAAREILARYGLADASFGSPTVTGYRLAAGRVSPAAVESRATAGAGGMVASLADLLALARLLARADDPLIAAALERTTPAGPGARFAAGFALLDRTDGTVLWRGGATEGFTAEMVTTGNRTAIVLANTTPTAELQPTTIDLIR